MLDLPGWWKRPGRTLRRGRSFELCRATAGGPADPDHRRDRHARPGLRRGSARIAGCPRADQPRRARHPDEASIAAALERHKPWAVINTAGWVRTLRRPSEKPDECFRPTPPARNCWPRPAQHGIPLLTFSSDLVFDGRSAGPTSRATTRAGLRLRPQQGGGRGAAAGDRRRRADRPHQRLLRPVGPLQFPVQHRRAA